MVSKPNWVKINYLTLQVSQLGAKALEMTWYLRLILFMAIQVLIAATYPIIRAGIRTFVEADPELEIVGEATDKSQALQLAYDLAPDVILLGLPISDIIAVEALPSLFEGFPVTKFLLVISSPEPCDIKLFIQSGTMGGYVSTTVGQEELCQAIKVLNAREASLRTEAE